MEHLLQRPLRVLRKLSKRLKPLRSSVLYLAIGLGLIFFGGINYYRVRILSFNQIPPAAQESTANLDIPVEVIIPSIDLDLTVDPGQIVNGVWQISASNATFLSTSAPPGSGGNTVIYGHNKKIIFGNLPYLSIGQKITLKTKSGRLYSYIVTDKYFVGPDRVDLVSPSASDELTIYTCWGAFDQIRAVIKAMPSD